jgi:hypothetical protein
MTMLLEILDKIISVPRMTASAALTAVFIGLLMWRDGALADFILANQNSGSNPWVGVVASFIIILATLNLLYWATTKYNRRRRRQMLEKLETSIEGKAKDWSDF